ncbi:hypothetical protein ACEPPN_015469 [Leptodophora sp. 'Broadleaf-Isolate-01']
MAVAGQAGQTDDGDGDSAPKSKRFTAARTPKRKTDTIVVVSEEEDFSSRLPRRTRKPSAKAKQNEADQDVFGRRRLDSMVGGDE